jgi:hypothetical protein
MNKNIEFVAYFLNEELRKRLGVKPAIDYIKKKTTD